jgi:hypothetical protein
VSPKNNVNKMKYNNLELDPTSLLMYFLTEGGWEDIQKAFSLG